MDWIWFSTLLSYLPVCRRLQTLKHFWDGFWCVGAFWGVFGELFFVVVLACLFLLCFFQLKLPWIEKILFSQKEIITLFLEGFVLFFDGWGWDFLFICLFLRFLGVFLDYYYYFLISFFGGSCCLRSKPALLVPEDLNAQYRCQLTFDMLGLVWWWMKYSVVSFEIVRDDCIVFPKSTSALMENSNYQSLLVGADSTFITLCDNCCVAW